MALVIVFVITKGGDGGGDPENPTGDVAVVQGVPSEISRITVAEFEKAWERQKASRPALESGSTEYEGLRSITINKLIGGVWLRGSAEELGLSFTPKQVERTLAELEKTAELKKSMAEEEGQEIPQETSDYTHREALKATELKILETAIRNKVEEETPPPSKAEIADYYETKERSLFRSPESRDVRVVINHDKAKVEKAREALRADQSPANWEKVARKYSSDPKTSSKGGLISNIDQRESASYLESAISSSAVGALIGPFGSGNSWTVFEVVDIKPTRILTLAEARPMIKAAIEEKKPERHYAKFARSYRSKWTSRTHCEPDFRVESCANYRGESTPRQSSGSTAHSKPKDQP